MNYGRPKGATKIRNWYIYTKHIYYGGTPMRHRKTACFEALVLEPHFAQSCGRFLLLYSLGGRVRCKHPFIGRCKMWNCQFVQHLRAAYVQTVEQQWSNLLSGPVKQGNKVSLWGHSENRGEDAGVPRAPFKGGCIALVRWINQFIVCIPQDPIISFSESAMISFSNVIRTSNHLLELNGIGFVG